MNENCEFFLYITPGYTFVITHNSIIYSFEDVLMIELDEDDEWICEEGGIDIKDIDCWTD